MTAGACRSNQLIEVGSGDAHLIVVLGKLNEIVNRLYPQSDGRGQRGKFVLVKLPNLINTSNSCAGYTIFMIDFSSLKNMVSIYYQLICFD